MSKVKLVHESVDGIRVWDIDHPGASAATLEKTLWVKYHLMEVKIDLLTVDEGAHPPEVLIRTDVLLRDPKDLDADRLNDAFQAIIMLSSYPELHICPDCGVDHDVLDFAIDVLSPDSIQPFSPAPVIEMNSRLPRSQMLLLSPGQLLPYSPN